MQLSGTPLRMATFLAIQNTYTHVQMAICTPQAMSTPLVLDKTVASKECIPALEKLLKDNTISLDDLSFIAVNQGPGPFTTLRVVISTVNGLSFARNIPLVGVNGLEALAYEYPQTNKVILLNAFGGDVYYLIDAYGIRSSGVAPINLILQEIVLKIPDSPILFLGNGVNLHSTLISATFGDRALIPNPLPEVATLASIAQLGQAQWNEQTNICYQLQPLYYKQAFIG